MPEFILNTRVQRGELIAIPQIAALAKGEQIGDVLTIQVLRAGDFTDMYGKDFELSSADLDAYVANSNVLLAQEQVPIEIGHPVETAPAAAWYRKFFKKVIDGVEWICAEVELTALGAESLAQKLYKYFSSVINIETQVILGGGFVNRPAVSGQQPLGSLAANIRFKESTMAAQVQTQNSFSTNALFQMFKRALGFIKLEMSQEDAQRAIMDALRAKYADPLDEYSYTPWLVATYNDHVVVTKDGKYFSVPYAFEDDAVKLGDPVEVEIAYQPKSDSTAAASDAAALQQNSPATALLSQAAVISPHQSNPQGGDSSMPQSNAQETTSASAPTAPAAPTTTTASNPPDVQASFEMQLAAARTEARQAAEIQQQEFERRLAEARQAEWNRAQTEMTRRQEVASLVIKLTSGTRQFPMRPDELSNILVKLSDADRALITPLLEKLHDSGMVELGERGTTNTAGGPLKTLPPEAQVALARHINVGGKVETFFKANAHLGKQDEYDLSAFIVSHGETRK